MKSILKNSLLMLAVAVVVVAQSSDASAQTFDPADDAQANAVLDLDTGEVTLNIGTSLQVLGLEAGGANIFDVAAFDATTGLGPAGQLGANGIGFLGLTPFPAGSFNLGAILDPSVRTEAALADFTFQFGAAGVPADTGTVANPGVNFIGGGPPAGVPEPGSLSLLALAGLGVVARRRR